MEFFGNGGKEFLRIGSFSIATYAVCIMIGIVIASFVAIKEGKKLGLDKDVILDGILFCVPLSIIGARLYYVIFEFNNVTNNGNNIGNIFRIQDGGLAITGGIIVAVVFMILYAKKKEESVFKIFDIVAPGLLIGQIFGRWGNFFNQEAHGGVVENLELLYKVFPDFIINHMQINGIFYHPTFLYESIWNTIGLCIILVARRTLRKIQLGDILGFYLIWYGFGRGLLIEPFRTDALMFLGMRVNVVLSILMSIGGIVFIIVKHIKFPQQQYQDCINEVKFMEEVEKENLEIQRLAEEKECKISVTK